MLHGQTLLGRIIAYLILSNTQLKVKHQLRE
nr:MAG TPA: hypothetical protein [Caudoviricetes sp.]